MVYFCPYCCNILLIEETPSELRFYCKTCPYVFYPKGKLSRITTLSRKKVDDVLGTFDTGSITESKINYFHFKRFQFDVRNVIIRRLISCKCKLDLLMNQ